MGPAQNNSTHIALDRADAAPGVSYSRGQLHPGCATMYEYSDTAPSHHGDVH